MRSLAAGAAGIVLLAACSGGHSDVDVAANNSADAAPPVEKLRLAQPKLQGNAGGLSSGPRRVSFGEPLANAVALTEALGGHGDRLQQLDECGAGPLAAVRIGDLLLLGEGDKFVGWHISDSAELHFRTDRGVTIGTPLIDLKRAYEIELFESSIGTEFTSTTGVGGLLTDASPTAQVSHLWAGTTCIFR